MDDRYVPRLRDSWGWCVCDNRDMRDNNATKARGTETEYRPAVVAAHVKTRGLAERICRLLNEGETA